MATAFWRVDSYHVNVGNGDCSIHVLAYLSPGKPALAYKCILIDGGSTWMSIDPGTGSNGYNPIRDMVTYLGTSYDWENGRCQFDTVVLSHWDEDHYGNLLQTIKQDAAQNVGIISYLRYDSKNRPATYFYTPNWFSGYRLNGAPSSYITSNQGLAWINTAYVPRGQTTIFDWVPFGILRAPEDGFSGVLGAEFFNNTVCNVPLAQVTDITQLVRANPACNPAFATATMPSMYCIGVYQIVLGGPPFEVIQEDPTRTNRVSIACILYWTDTKRISHYLAGDADQVTEGKVLSWLLAGGHPGRMTSVKLSHHGSRSSTPITNPGLLRTAGPKNVVLSIPSGMHIHPCK